MRFTLNYGGPEVRLTSDDLVVKLAILVVKLAILVVKLAILVAKIGDFGRQIGDFCHQFDGQKSRIFFSWPDRHGGDGGGSITDSAAYGLATYIYVR